jgi:hypothetical protein
VDDSVLMFNYGQKSYTLHARIEMFVEITAS